MAKFILFLHEDPQIFADFSPADMQRVIEDYTAWSKKLGQQGRLLGGQKLMDEGGRLMNARDGALSVTDGPYAEVKDVIGGFFMVEAADYADAQALSADCPHLKYGGTIALRQVHEF